ncbi:MAG: GH32 C-terminal domain-containing protein [Muribaculaceae bacterium]|nr:GH32 C-terminal domain-containing protein [Muribaculaceae bacterium]
MSAFLGAFEANSKLVAHFPMDVISGEIVESVSGEKFAVEGNFAPENLPGAVGEALRFDGYTSHIKGSLGDILPSGSKQVTVSMWVAVPSYPIIKIDTDTQEKTAIATCLDTDSKTGFGFYIGFNGKYSFRMFLGGWPVNIDVDTPLPTYQWNNLVAVVDCDARYVKLYNNGVEVGAGRATGSISYSPCSFYMGQGVESNMSGPFELMSFNGLLDDISVWDEAKSLDEIKGWKAENDPNLDIPDSRFAEDLLRPRFHGMPAAGWTNECHGMYYSEGRYHLFFQKNGDGPYMARLHWGHISSENLYDWREEKIALAPGDWYDIKGCWSGCVFSDEVVTGGQPNIIYTAVDYAKAMVAQAMPETESLDNWVKYDRNPIINGRPSGLSDDFRDPYFFRKGENGYIIVGSSSNGVGTTTLHRYNASAGNWISEGQFFTGKNAATDGRFWEMPNVTQMSDGKWLFTATPLETSRGVRTLYWTGGIGDDGRFVADVHSSEPRAVELNSREGFGMLSPTVYNHDGKTIALGIVPDKLSSADNWHLGWAHCYSLPREWQLSSDGLLLQKPYEGLRGMRTGTSYSEREFELSGHYGLEPVSGRSVEVCGVFEVGNAGFGFKIFKSDRGEGIVRYVPATGELVVDFTGLRRLVNDGGVYDGIYRCPLPEHPAIGSELKINMYIDHSIIDIFVNDRWATSIRVFPTEKDADGIEVYSDSIVRVKSLEAWVLDASGDSASVGSISDTGVEGFVPGEGIYTLSGVREGTVGPDGELPESLPDGVYVSGGRKVIVNNN